MTRSISPEQPHVVVVGLRSGDDWFYNSSDPMSLRDAEAQLKIFQCRPEYGTDHWTCFVKPALCLVQ